MLILCNRVWNHFGKQDVFTVGERKPQSPPMWLCFEGFKGGNWVLFIQRLPATSHSKMNKELLALCYFCFPPVGQLRNHGGEHLYCRYNLSWIQQTGLKTKT